MFTVTSFKVIWNVSAYNDKFWRLCIPAHDVMCLCRCNKPHGVSPHNKVVYAVIWVFMFFSCLYRRILWRQFLITRERLCFRENGRYVFRNAQTRKYLTRRLRPCGFFCVSLKQMISCAVLNNLIQFSAVYFNFLSTCARSFNI
jgi:hypothetical protein